MGTSWRRGVDGYSRRVTKTQRTFALREFCPHPARVDANSIEHDEEIAKGKAMKLRALIAEATKGPWDYTPKDGRKNQGIHTDYEWITIENVGKQRVATFMVRAWKIDRKSAIPTAKLITYLFNHAERIANLCEAAQTLSKGINDYLDINDIHELNDEVSKALAAMGEI